MPGTGGVKEPDAFYKVSEFPALCLALGAGGQKARWPGWEQQEMCVRERERTGSTGYWRCEHQILNINVPDPGLTTNF